jgi:hypothetical protein
MIFLIAACGRSHKQQQQLTRKSQLAFGMHVISLIAHAWKGKLLIAVIK